jgi:hypothetical protein
MTYPEPTYLDDTGEVSATYRQADHTPELTYPTGNTAHYLATGASTGGLFGLYRWVMGPQPSGPGPHFHRSIAESFYVLTGTVGSTTGHAGSTPSRATTCTSRSGGSTGSATSPANRPRC